MAGRPPREGARWGADPDPNYVKLCEEYSEKYTSRALYIVSEARKSLPESPPLKGNDFIIAREILECAKNSLEIAKSDGRSRHTFDKTLDILEQSIVSLLQSAPKGSKISEIVIKYGDEYLGVWAKRQRDLAADALRVEREKEEARKKAQAILEEERRREDEILYLWIIPIFLAIGAAALDLLKNRNVGSALLMGLFVGIVVILFTKVYAIIVAKRSTRR